MTGEILTWQQLHEKITNQINNATEEGTTSEIFHRGNFTDICQILGNYTILDADKKYEVYINLQLDEVIVNISYEQ